MTFVWLLVLLAVLAGITLVGWYVVAPALQWIIDKIFLLSLKGHEYRAMARGYCLDETCCDMCRGTGVSGDIETNGMCWDCRGTGHPHAQPA